MLYLCSTLKEFKALRQSLKDCKLGFVPTMGNLHQGHISLLRRSLEENELSLVSIFVNPTQFAPGEDFEKYPRTLEQDLEKIKEAIELFNKDQGLKRSVIVFSPASNKEVYPEEQVTHLSAGKMGRMLEGAVRPEHFDGVVTVVNRLFEMFKPDRAYFGKKDFQQYAIIKQMVQERNLEVELESLPIKREASGLALSSRNSFLSETEKEKGLNLYRSLREIKNILLKTKSLEQAQEKIDSFTKTDKNFNYLVMRDASSLEEPRDLLNPIVILGNYQVGGVRLIDNMEVHFNQDLIIGTNI